MSKKIKVILLCSIFAYSINISHHSFTMNNGNNANNGPYSWRKTVIWIIVPALIHATITHIIPLFVDRFYNQQTKDAQMLQNLVAINKQLKIQLGYIKKHCYNIKLVKKIEKEYLESCIKLMEFQKNYYKKYGKK